MENHFHLILKQISRDAITTFMRCIMNSYTKYFNKKYERVGPLFQGKFKALLVDKDEYLLHLTRYIHLNPIAHREFTVDSVSRISGYIIESETLKRGPTS